MALSAVNSSRSDIAEKVKAIGALCEEIDGDYLNTFGQEKWCTKTSFDTFSQISSGLNDMIENINKNSQTVINKLGDALDILHNTQGSTAADSVSFSPITETKVSWTYDDDNPKFTETVKTVTDEKFVEKLTRIISAIDEITEATNSATNELGKTDADEGEYKSACASLIEALQAAQDTLKSYKEKYSGEVLEVAAKADQAYAAAGDTVRTSSN